ncbi:MAG: F0F1 ATP synthase subunit B [Patescibacteria group bacterium]
MFNIPVQFAEASEPASGIGAFNINLKSFLFQLTTFVIVLLVLKRWVLPPLMTTMEKRRETLEKSLEQAKATQEALAQAETRAEEIIAKARVAADEALAEGRKTIEGMIVNAEATAAERAALIIKDAEARLGQERQRLRTELRAELAELVAAATEKIIRQKLDKQADRILIEQSLKELA